MSWCRGGPGIRIVGCCQQQAQMGLCAAHTPPFRGSRSRTPPIQQPSDTQRPAETRTPPSQADPPVPGSQSLCRQEPPHTPGDPITYCVVTESAHFQSSRHCQHPYVPRHSHRAPDSQSPDLIATRSPSWCKPWAGEHLSAHHARARVCTDTETYTHTRPSAQGSSPDGCLAVQKVWSALYDCPSASQAVNCRLCSKWKMNLLVKNRRSHARVGLKGPLSVSMRTSPYPADSRSH